MFRPKRTQDWKNPVCPVNTTGRSRFRIRTLRKTLESQVDQSAESGLRLNHPAETTGAGLTPSAPQSETQCATEELPGCFVVLRSRDAKELSTDVSSHSVGRPGVWRSDTADRQGIGARHGILALPRRWSDEAATRALLSARGSCAGPAAWL